MAESTNSFDITTFSFSSWMSETYPCEDDTTAKSELLKLLTNYFEGNYVFYSTRQTLLDLLDMVTVLQQNNTEDQINSKLLHCLSISLDNLKTQWNEVSRDQFITVFNGYSLNVSALPISVKFWKNILNQKILSRTRRMTRASLENEFKLFVGRDYSVKFSHVLFCLSWLNILRVHNNTTIVVNSRNPISFF